MHWPRRRSRGQSAKVELSDARVPAGAEGSNANLLLVRIWVKLKTHSAGGITDKDFALAKKIEEVVLWRPPAGGPLTGNPNKFVKGS